MSDSSPLEVQIADSINDDDDGALLGSEIRWVKNQKMIESHGYILRPRFRPGWVPSWWNTNKEPRTCEDYHFNIHKKTIDATRLSDGTSVFIKQILNFESNEVSIARFLGSKEMFSDPRNHCVPIIDVFTDPSLENWTFLVMPVLRPFDDPPFFSVDEVLDFVKQTLEGLSFMHEHNVAHRDASVLNIMLDAKGMYPKGFHPGVQVVEPDFKKIAKPYRRRDVPSVKYYFTDFGLSVLYLDPDEPRLVTGTYCQDPEVPELSMSEPYSPFALDVFTLGNVYKHQIVEKFKNMSFLEPLVQGMTRRDPSARPTIDQALTEFENLIASQPGYRLRWRLIEHSHSKITRFFLGLSSVARECIFQSKLFLSRSSKNVEGLLIWRRT